MAGEGFIILDHHGHIVTYSPACHELTGFSLADASDSNRQYIAESLFPNFWEIAKAGPGHRRQLRMIHKDGHQISLDAVYTPIHNAHNEVTFVACTISHAPLAKATQDAPAGRAAVAGEVPQTAPPNGRTLDEILQEVERRTILAALRSTGGRRTEAAAQMGISRSRLYRRLEALGI